MSGDANELLKTYCEVCRDASFEKKRCSGRETQQERTWDSYRFDVI
jgi:hypothetical protein